MRAAIVIPARNAQAHGSWQEVLSAVSAQTMQPERMVVIDSASEDATCSAAAAFHWECWNIRRDEFNHGLTRDFAVRKLAAEGIDTVIFLSQDVILATPDALQKLTDFLWNNPVSGCYGRQYTEARQSLNGWQRKECYPENSSVKTMVDVPRLGIMTPFFSDAFSAWKTADVIRVGGFPETDFGEDVLLAAKILLHRGAIGYCAEAVARHEHSDSLRQLFLRGMQVGAFHRKHPELRKHFAGNLPCTRRTVPFALWLPFAIKGMGYVLGRLTR